MDLLGRPDLRLSFCSIAIQTYQIARIRECESGSGVGAWGWGIGKFVSKCKWEGEWEW